VHLPRGKKTTGCKWVFKVKHKADGSIKRHKDHLVEKGFTQTKDIDLFDTFSLVVKMPTIITLLSIAFIQHWHLEQLDVNTTTLHGDLDKEVYMKPPVGLHLSDPTLVWKLGKSLYGLCQASRQ